MRLNGIHSLTEDQANIGEGAAIFGKRQNKSPYSLSFLHLFLMHIKPFTFLLYSLRMIRTDSSKSRLRLHNTPVAIMRGRKTRRPRVDATVPPNFRILSLDKFHWSLAARRLLVLEDEDILVFAEIAVDVFQRTARSLWILGNVSTVSLNKYEGVELTNR